MIEIVPFVLWVWIPVSLGLFAAMRRLPRLAVLICIVGGWAVLPTAAFAPSDLGAGFPYWIVGCALPSDPWLSKGIVLGISALGGTVLFHPRSVVQLRPRWMDVPVAFWCLWPMISALANHMGVVAGVRDCGYLALAWGVPYVMGRTWFGNLDGLLYLTKGFVAAGLGYVPLCLVEILVGPHFYVWLYGGHPFESDGATRYIGYRPIGLLEHGNQLGMWMAGAALAAVVLWSRGSLRKTFGLSPGAIVSLLIAFTLACQSVGSIILLGVGVALVAGMRWVGARRIVAVVGAVFVLVIGVRAAGVFSARAFARKTSLGHLVERSFREAGRGSFGWRLAREEQHLKKALEKPVTGWGQWDWWREKNSRPWGLWLLVMGMWGIPGVMAVYCVMLLPAGRALWQADGPALRGELAPAAAMAVLLVITAADSLLNSMVVLPVIMAAGALGGWAARGSEAVRVPVHRLQRAG